MNSTKSPLPPAQPREEALFHAALQLGEGPGRVAFLDQACAGDPALRARLDALLAAHQQIDDLSATQPDAARPTIKLEFADEPPDEAVGQTLGRYKLLEKVGEGGCGVVYVAEQTEPVRRRVALKVIKLGMDTKQVVARFEAERQALAMMDHPNIAKVLDAGTTELGRPYFVMELVRGIRITDYCDQNNLATKERLELFIKVCQAIQHAHQKGIIHRDIKPSNILVTLHDGVPVPKVIDFGIAKATEGRLTDMTVYTQLHQFIGTPAYMSPEQAEMSGLDIDTRSDIYSLGVLLYELLVGSTPFDAKELMASGIDAMRKTIREKEPTRPSTKLGSLLGEEQTMTAKRRSVEISKLANMVKGDLDWIVMKCLEKDRTRRYETANGLGADLKRHLTNEPVVACPPSAAYKFQKAMRRNKMACAAGAAVFLALIGGLSLAALGWRQTLVEKDRAVQAKAGEEKQRKEAQASARLAQKQKNEADHLLYVANINLAQQAWDQNNIGRLRELLRSTQDSPYLGFEWHYWQAKIHLARKTLRGHLDNVQSVAFSPDGGRIVTGSYDKTAKVWDIRSGRELLQINGHSAQIACAAFSPDGQRIVTCSADGTTKVWDSATGKELLTLRGHGSLIYSVAYSPDGQRIVTGSGDRTAKVWDAGSGNELFALKGHARTINSVCFSPDGRRIATGSADKTATLWNSSDGKKLVTLTGHSNEVFSVAFDPDGKRVLTASWDNTAMVWDAATGTNSLILKGHNGAILGAVFSHDGKRIVTGSSDLTAKVWDAESGRELLTFKGHSEALTSVAFSPDDQTIATGSRDGTVVLWNATRSGAPLSLDARTGWISVAYSPDGRRIVTGSWDNTARVWDAASGKELLTLTGHTNYVYSVAFSPDGNRIVTGSADNRAKVWEAGSGKDLLTLKGHSDGVRSAAFSPDGRRIVTCGGDRTAKVWDSATGKELLTLRGHGSVINSAAYSPDGQRIVTGSWDKTAKVWDAERGTERFTLHGHTKGVLAVAFSLDGQRILTGSADESARVWDANTGTNLFALLGHTDWVESVGFSPDGKRILTGCDDYTAKVWEASSGREVLTLKGHRLEVDSVMFSPDGIHIVTGSADSAAKVWEAARPEQVAAWQEEERAGEQHLALLRQVAETEVKAAAETAARELAALAGTPELAPKHQPSAQERPVMPDDPGVIRQWLVLAPLPFSGNADLNVLKQQIPGEARLHPRVGERPAAAQAGLAWSPVRLGEASYKLDFVELVKRAKPEADTAFQVAYAVTYIVSHTPQAGLMLLAGCDDTARIYLNEKEIYRQLEPRSFMEDQDEVTGVNLKAGLNTLVFKVANGTVDWAGSVRLLDGAGQPVKGVTVTLDPEGKDLP